MAESARQLSQSRQTYFPSRAMEGLGSGTIRLELTSGHGAGRSSTTSLAYFCPVHLGHGKSSGGKLRSITAEIRKGLREQRLIAADDDVCINELVFDYAPEQLADARREVLRTCRREVEVGAI